MKLKEYAEHITELAKIYPEAVVISAADDEGNGFKPVIYKPTAGKYSRHSFDVESDDVNAVCIN